MKFIYIMVLLSSMLFAMQKQIILGSYSIESNGLNAVTTVQKQIDNDAKLKIVMDENSAEVMPTVISGYTVVSVNIFDSYTALLPAMKVLKTYYGDAFVLKYPTKGFLNRESLKEVEKKAQEEALAQAKILEEEKKVLLDQKNAAVELERKRLQEASEKEAQSIQEVENKTEQIQTIKEPAPIKSMSELMNETRDSDDTEENTFFMENYLLLGALALLVLLIGGFIVYKKTASEDEDK